MSWGMTSSWVAGPSDRSSDDWPPLCTAAYHGDSVKCTHLLEGGAEVDEVNRDSASPLLIAVKRGHVDCCAILAKQGANLRFISKDGETLLYIATENGDDAVCTVLIDAGANVNQPNLNYETPIFAAANRGRTSTCALLANHGADTGHCLDHGSTALHFAAVGGHADICKVLLDAGADVNAMTVLMETPLFFAAEDLATASLLVKCGANPNIVDTDGTGPLFAAVRHGDARVCQAILEIGADVNAGNIYGVTSLHMSVIGVNEGVTELLLNYGSEANRASTGYVPTPLAAAADNNDVAACKILLQHSGNVLASTAI